MTKAFVALFVQIFLASNIYCNGWFYTKGVKDTYQKGAEFTFEIIASEGYSTYFKLSETGQCEIDDKFTLVDNLKLVLNTQDWNDVQYICLAAKTDQNKALLQEQRIYKITRDTSNDIKHVIDLDKNQCRQFRSAGKDIKASVGKCPAKLTESITVQSACILVAKDNYIYYYGDGSGENEANRLTCESGGASSGIEYAEGIKSVF